MSEPTSCLRCGDFPGPGGFAVPNIPYCAACIDREQGDDNRMMVFPPRAIFWSRIRTLSIYALVGLVLGLCAGLLLVDSGLIPSLGADWLMPLLGAELGLTFGIILGLALNLSRLQHRGAQAWRRHLISELAIEPWSERPDLRLDLVLVVLARPSFFTLRVPMEAGILASGSGGFLFLGSQGKRLALPLEHIAAVATERMKTLPTRTALRLNLTETGRQEVRVGSGLVFAAFLDESSFRANKAKAEARAAELEALIQREPSSQS